MRDLNRRNILKYTALVGAAWTLRALPVSLRSAMAGEVREIGLTASVADLDLGVGKPFKAWLYNGRLPGPEIRVNEGETLRVRLKNELPEETSIHWHGVPVPNVMDGMPGITQKPVMPGETFVYEFKAAPAGTYLYHSHASYQLDRGLYGPLVIVPRREEGGYDKEYVLMLEDWALTDGGGPEAAKAGRTRSGMGMMDGMMDGMMEDMMGEGGMMGMMESRPRASEPLREPRYDAYAINGKVFRAGPPFKVRRGDRVRLRIISPSSSTIHTLRIAGHSLKLTHADGRPIVPVEVDVLRIGPGERYDVELRADHPGRWCIYDLEGGGPGEEWPLATLLYDGVRSKGYDSENISRLRMNDYELLDGLGEPALMPVGDVDRVFRMTLSGGMMGSPYWTINGKGYPDTDKLSIRTGQHVRLEYFNMSMMDHPMHLHGHFFEVAGSGRNTGVRIKKDTIIIPGHMGRGAVEFIADNPGNWFHHCHNLYHMMGGMANIVRIG